MRKLMVALLVAFAMLLLLLNVSLVAAATGEVFWLNPPENHGKVRDDMGDDGDATRVYVIHIPQGTEGDYVPSAGDRVDFTPGPGQTASGVTKCQEHAEPDDPAFCHQGMTQLSRKAHR